jgi:hypothetical protein
MIKYHGTGHWYNESGRINMTTTVRKLIDLSFVKKMSLFIYY